jgi:putative OPT family oligopeptide transporter
MLLDGLGPGAAQYPAVSSHGAGVMTRSPHPSSAMTIENFSPSRRRERMENKGYKPFVPADKVMTEFSIKALLLGLLMTVILGAANAYLGLKAGMTIAATYPAAVIGMAVLRIFRGSILEENFARTVGSIGESVAAGAIFTIPAFAILQLWDFDHLSLSTYLKATALMMVGGTLGILFVTMLRRVMVEDPDLKFPESVAAAEIHKAGQRGGAAAAQLFQAMGFGAIIQLLGQLNFFKPSNDITLRIGELGKSIVRLGVKKDSFALPAGGLSSFSAPAVSPAYFGVGYIIGPELGALNFAGGLLAWGLLVPLLIFVLGPTTIASWAQAQGMDVNADSTWLALAAAVWRFVVRPIAVGGMLVGATYTLYRMRKNLIAGIKRSAADVKKSAGVHEATARHDKDLNFNVVLMGIGLVFILMVLLYHVFAGSWGGALVAALVMIVAGFLFAAVSGNLVGMIGSSNNPVSGLTLATLILAALLILLIRVTGDKGVAAVLGVASVVCVSSAVAGEMLQDLKVGHILGGTPYKMQIGDLFGVLIASSVMIFPLYILHHANIQAGGTGFGDRALPAPQAGLMAMLSQGIVGGQMAWPLVIVGIVMGISMIMVKVRSPMLFSVGMYLPIETTFAIFVGGLIRGLVNHMASRRGFNDAQKVRVENAGVLAAAGLIAGEALMGLVIAAVVFKLNGPFYNQHLYAPPWVLAVLVALVLAAYLIYRPLGKAGSPDEPPPPSAMM